MNKFLNLPLPMKDKQQTQKLKNLFFMIQKSLCLYYITGMIYIQYL